MLAVLLIDVFLDGVPYLDMTLFTNPPSSDPAIAGARPATFLPRDVHGHPAVDLRRSARVGTAVYLEEHADQDARWYNKRARQVNIPDPAAMPSIVYDILGLAFLVAEIGLERRCCSRANVLLALLVLATVIIAAREAIRWCRLNRQGRLCTR